MMNNLIRIKGVCIESSKKNILKISFIFDSDFYQLKWSKFVFAQKLLKDQISKKSKRQLNLKQIALEHKKIGHNSMKFFLPNINKIKDPKI